ncbi:hypothetical protein K490DRAFT_69296 [Saccharata proteae CBS 121410]|uniref:Uncharacterized protein n=1 Tax=Saccharata proteae CBS 121410 TaxID=1314787 RepID=A0A9P4HQ39_9PEZI|nr:hypothetical protein K490DRAFT_69296 [Saccharata proteae CBS 121410]
MQPFGTSGHSRFSPFLLNNTERSAYGEPDTTIWAELVQRLEERLTSALSASSSPWWNMTTDIYPIEQEHQHQAHHPYQHQLHPSDTRAAATTQHAALFPDDARGETASGTTLRVQSRARSSSASSTSSSDSSSVPPVDVVGTAADPIKPTTLPVLRPDATRLRTHSWIVNHSDSMEDDSISPVNSLPSGSEGNKRLGPGAVVPRTPYARVPTESAFEMAYFLKNTGPNMPLKVGEPTSSDGAGAKRKTRHRSVFKILGGTKGRKSLAERVGTVEHHPDEVATTIFVPPEGVVQKVSSEGKKYLQIVTGNEPAGSQPYQTAPTKSNEPWKKRTSATLPEQFSSLGTDTFDTWLSTLGLQSFDQVVESVHQVPPELPRAEATEPKKLRQTSSASALDTISSSDRRSEYAIKLVQEPEEEAPNGTSVDAKDAPPSNLLTKRPASKADVATDIPPPNASTPKDIDDLPSQVARRLRERSSSERLSGQGLRRPSRERPQSQIILARSSSLADDVNGHNRVDSLMNRSDTASPSSERNALRGRSLDGLTRHGSREDKIRARKIRDLNRTRGIDAIVRKPLPSERLELEEVDRATATTCDHLERAKLIQQRRKEKASSVQNDLEARSPPSPHVAPPSQVPVPTPTSTTGYTPVSGTIAISPIVTVAEQRPLPRANKDVKKPARLVLRETSQHVSRPSAIAVRSSNSNARYSRDDSVLALASEQRFTRASRDELGGRTAHRARRASSLKFVPGVVETAGTSRMSHGTLRTPSAMSFTTSLGVASSEASRTSKVRSLEARVDALERQNKLLEAALQAVLKTSGEMKRCACEARREEERKRNEGGRVWSGGSALDVWLETRGV